MNTEDSEFARIEREQAMRGVPDRIHYSDLGKTLEYITGWNDCRAAMLADQPAPVQGWKLVPVKPTKEMVDALADTDPERDSIWDAVLSAAPQAPKETT